MDCTDPGNPAILEKLMLNRKKYSNIKESKSIISIYEKHVFVWHDAGSCILTSAVEDLKTKNAMYKTLTFTNPPTFEVETILFNKTGSLLALNGRNGVMVYEVPWRYGKFNSSNPVDGNIIGRSWNIAERFYICSNRINVVQIAWHPGSTSNTHLTILSTDNYIRTYDATDSEAPQLEISLTPTSANSFLSSESKVSFSACLGDNMVGFDFGLPENQPSISSKGEDAKRDVTVWPIFILNGNGDVYLVKCTLKKERNQPTPNVMGPLTMLPPSEDNYGCDACYILCLHSTPYCVIIATSNGILYHCIVLEDAISYKEEERELIWDMETQEVTLCVFESVELPLTLGEEQDDVYGHPVRLFKDITSKSKYHCTHVSGLHAVAIPMLQSIEKSRENGSIDHQDLKQPSIVEHLLCTQPMSKIEAVPVLGMDAAVTDNGIVMVCLLASWEFMCVNIVSSYFSSPSVMLSQNLSGDRDRQDCGASAFQQQIESVFQRSVCSPFLKAMIPKDPNDFTPQQCLDLLYNFTQRLREDSVYKQNRVQSLLKSRIKVLTQQKEYQLQDVKRLLQDREALEANAEKLSQKYAVANAKQPVLLKRIESVLLNIQKNLPYLSNAEIDMKETLLSYEEKIKQFSSSIDLIKKKLKQHQEKTKDEDVLPGSDIQTFSLTENQIKHVKELLLQQGESIADLMQKLSTLKMDMGT